MELIIKNIPQEYLALKINYCRMMLRTLPEYKIQVHNVKGVPIRKIVSGDERHVLDSKTGMKLYEEMKRREFYTGQLNILEAIWESEYKIDPLKECVPRKICRTMYADTFSRLTLNRAYFDSLENDDNNDKGRSLSYPFNGIYYRSAGERDIAVCYTELGIPFKYEPSVMLKGLNRPVHPDFVIYIEELDNCKFHEHFGVKQSSQYLRETSFKYNNYTNAGLVPETDIIFTHDTDEIPFDIRALTAKLNTAVYTTILSGREAVENDR